MDQCAPQPRAQSCHMELGKPSLHRQNAVKASLHLCSHSTTWSLSRSRLGARDYYAGSIRVISTPPPCFLVIFTLVCYGPREWPWYEFTSTRICRMAIGSSDIILISRVLYLPLRAVVARSRLMDPTPFCSISPTIMLVVMTCQFLPVIGRLVTDAVEGTTLDPTLERKFSLNREHDHPDRLCHQPVLWVCGTSWTSRCACQKKDLSS